MRTGGRFLEKNFGGCRCRFEPRHIARHLADGASLAEDCGGGRAGAVRHGEEAEECASSAPSVRRGGHRRREEDDHALLPHLGRGDGGAFHAATRRNSERRGRTGHRLYAHGRACASRRRRLGACAAPFARASPARKARRHRRRPHGGGDVLDALLHASCEGGLHRDGRRLKRLPRLSASPDAARPLRE